MALRHALARPDDADLLDCAVAQALACCRTADIAQAGLPMVSTAAMGAVVVEVLDRLDEG
jgi:hypothetical protein